MSVRKNSTPTRFIGVGIINTSIDFSLFFTLSLFLMPAVAANFIATSIALAFSFFASRNYTFAGNSTLNVRRQITLFPIVTLAALWLIQPLVISLTLSTTDLLMIESWQALLTAKLFATVASLTWNYIFYSRYIFIGQRPTISSVESGSRVE